MKKVFLVVGIWILFATLLLLPQVAFAAHGFHGIYTDDANTCAGCHREHSLASLSSSPETIVALTTSPTLTTNSEDTTESCLTCHGVGATGAYTNVMNGIYEKIPEREPVERQLLEDESTPGAVLNGGGFLTVGGSVEAGGRPVTSRHEIDAGIYTAWGGGTVGPGYTDIALECASCHDVHTSTNYRMLRDRFFEGTDHEVNATRWVQSNETNFPEEGFAPHTEFGNYIPNYTTPYYKTPQDRTQGISGWCSACHTQYMNDSFYDAGDGQGRVWRIRHSIANAYLGKYTGKRLRPGEHLTTSLPLDKASRDTSQTNPLNYLNCLTCHRAHGTDATVTDIACIPPAGTPTGDPATNDSILLRLNNRGVCQDCHKM